MEMNDFENNDEQLAALLQLAGSRPSVPAGVAGRVRLAARDAWQQELRRGTRRCAAGWLGAVAAAVVLALLLLMQPRKAIPPAPRLIATVQLTGGATSAHMGSEVAVGSVVSTAPESFATLQWRDRGSLRIAADSRIRFIGDDSIQLDRGAVYFASASSGRPVLIRTKFGMVRDIGTAFEVRLQTAALRIRVREGSIELQRNGARERAGAGIELLAQHSGVTRSTISTTGTDWNWVLAAAPPITLDGNARGVLTAIAREKGLTLVFTDHTLADRVDRMSLHDRVPLTPDEALAAAAVAADLSYRISGSTLMIERRQRR